MPKVDGKVLMSPSWIAVWTQLLGWIFWGAWYTFTTSHNSKMIELINQQNIPTRLSVIESKLRGYDSLGDKIDLLNLQLARFEARLAVQEVTRK